MVIVTRINTYRSDKTVMPRKVVVILPWNAYAKRRKSETMSDQASLARGEMGDGAPGLSQSFAAATVPTGRKIATRRGDQQTLHRSSFTIAMAVAGERAQEIDAMICRVSRSASNRAKASERRQATQWRTSVSVRQACSPPRIFGKSQPRSSSTRISNDKSAGLTMEAAH